MMRFQLGLIILAATSALGFPANVAVTTLSTDTDTTSDDNKLYGFIGPTREEYVVSLSNLLPSIKPEIERGSLSRRLPGSQGQLVRLGGGDTHSSVQDYSNEALLIQNLTTRQCFTHIVSGSHTDWCQWNACKRLHGDIHEVDIVNADDPEWRIGQAGDEA